jgi:2-desacetyl-2-hydroxyethyl bacteriochlorophyllide A dehydrogenase
MQAIVLNAPGEFELVDQQIPEPPTADQVQVRVRRVGICGTDLHAYSGHQPFFTYPRVLGHELAVEVMEIGPTTRQHDLHIGDRCCIRPYMNCGQCGACRRGFENCCTKMRVMGVHYDGGMCEITNVPLDKLHKSFITDEELALVEMLSIGAHAVRRAQIIPGEFALVIGMGPIGLGVSQFAYHAGARVIGMDISEKRLEFARKQPGIEYFIDARQNVIEQLHAILPDDLPTAVFDATGSAHSMMKTFDYTAHAGRLVFVGLFQGDVTFHDPEFHRRELSLFASRNATTQDFDHVLQLLEQQKIDVASWITRCVFADQLITEFSSWLEPENGVVKAMLSFQ